MYLHTFLGGGGCPHLSSLLKSKAVNYLGWWRRLEALFHCRCSDIRIMHWDSIKLKLRDKTHICSSCLWFFLIYFLFIRIMISTPSQKVLFCSALTTCADHLRGSRPLSTVLTWPPARQQNPPWPPSWRALWRAFGSFKYYITPKGNAPKPAASRCIIPMPQPIS